MTQNTRGKIFKTLFLACAFVLSIIACKKEDEPPTSTDPVAVDYHQTATTQFVETDGAKYAYRVLGDKGGIPLVLVSPLAGGLDDWDPAITNGLAQQYKVVIFDNKGVGSSTGKTPSTIAAMARDAVSFIKALGYTKVNLMGFSMGGFVTQQIVLTEPALVNKIILTGTGPKGAEGLSKLPELLAATQGLSKDESFLRFGFTDSETSRNAGKAALARVNKRTVNRDAPLTEEASTAELTAVLAWAQPYPEALNELKAVTQPALIVDGDMDLPVPVINSVNMSKSIAKSQLVVFPDAGHASFMQNPDKFVQYALDFLGK